MIDVISFSFVLESAIGFLQDDSYEIVYDDISHNNDNIKLLVDNIVINALDMKKYATN